MRTPEEKIKAAILHGEEEIRCVAARYFADGYSADASIMPLVIESVGKYGRETAFALLRIADRLAQTPATVRWLMEELGRAYDLKDVGQDNYRCAVALILCKADPHLLVPVEGAILARPAFPHQLREDLTLQVERASWDWPTGWAALQEWGEELMEAGDFDNWDAGQGQAIVGVLGRFREEGGETILNLLHRRYRGYSKDLVQWLEPQLVALAGEMKLEAAIPLLIDRLHEDDDPVTDEIGPALVKIGTAEVIGVLAKEWPEGDEDFRYSAIEAFENIHCDLSVQTALQFLPEEEDLEITCGLGLALLGNFAEEGIEPVRELVLEHDDEDESGDLWDLRHRLIAAATIMDRPFLEYPASYKEAVDERWGWGGSGSFRLVENLGPGAGELEQTEEEWDDEADFVDEPVIPPQPFVRKERKVGRNDPCPCGSGKKYKKCCLSKTPMDPASN